MSLIFPKDYDPKLTIKETQEAIKYIRDTFQKEFGKQIADRSDKKEAAVGSVRKLEVDLLYEFVHLVVIVTGFGNGGVQPVIRQLVKEPCGSCFVSGIVERVILPNDDVGGLFPCRLIQSG